MSRSDRDEGTPLVKPRTPEEWFLPLVGLLLAIALAWFVGTLQGGEYERRQSAPHQHAASAKKAAIAECSGRQGSSLVECVQEQIQAAEETSRSEQDLTAQQQAAWGSMLGSAWGAVGLVVTVIGTALLYQQIVLTREAVEDTGKATKAMEDANKIARDIGEAQVRCYLDIVKATISIERGVFCCRIKVKNSGQSPARKLRVGYQLGFPINGETVEDREIQWADWPESIPGMATTQITPWHDERCVIETDIQAWLARMGPLIGMTIRLKAEDVFEQSVTRKQHFSAPTANVIPGEEYIMVPAAHVISDARAELLRIRKGGNTT